MTRAVPINPLVTIVGATGTGKSQLAVEIAKKHNGEIINGDAMQLYAGIPIITNKITDEEQQGMPHHLLGCISLSEQTWVVNTFVTRTLKIIEEIRSRGKLPILVGGTHYYTQSLLFKAQLPRSECEEGTEDTFVEKPEDRWPILERSTEELLKELKRVDPVMAQKWHPNDRRKIRTSLMIYLLKGVTPSELYERQRQQRIAYNGTEADKATSPTEGTQMRFPTLIFWVHAEADTLRDRLDKRVDKMLEQGLLEEVGTLNNVAKGLSAGCEPADETRGIWVSIGYKEFKPYVTALEKGLMAEKKFEKLRSEAVERTRISTRQYAKRQIRWIRIKLANALAEADASKLMYLLEGSDITRFQEQVVAPALELTSQFLRALPMPEPGDLSPVASEMLKPKRDHESLAAPGRWSKQHCAVCNVTCVVAEQWERHVKSKAHRKLISKRRQKAEVEDLANNRDVQRPSHMSDYREVAGG